MDTKTKWLFATALALFFVTGVLGGIMLERKVLFPHYNQLIKEQDVPGEQQVREPRPDQPPHPEPPPPAEQDPVKNFVFHISQELGLDEEQKQKVTEIMESHQEDFQKVREEILDTFNELNMDLSKKILTVLDDEQKERFMMRYKDWVSKPPPQVEDMRQFRQNIRDQRQGMRQQRRQGQGGQPQGPQGMNGPPQAGPRGGGMQGRPQGGPPGGGPPQGGPGGAQQMPPQNR